MWKGSGLPSFFPADGLNFYWMRKEKNGMTTSSKIRQKIHNNTKMHTYILWKSCIFWKTGWTKLCHLYSLIWNSIIIELGQNQCNVLTENIFFATLDLLISKDLHERPEMNCYKYMHNLPGWGIQHSWRSYQHIFILLFPSSPHWISRG